MNWKYSEDKRSATASDDQTYIKSQDNIAAKADDVRHIQRNEDLIRQLMRVGENIRSVLDIGCREALTQDLFEKRGIEFLGMDVSPKSVEFAKSRGRNVVVGDAHKITESTDEKFDAIISVHSLEHCYDPELVLSEMSKCLRPKGYIAIRVPIQKDITVQPLLEDGAKHSDEGLPAHYSVFTPESLLSLIRKYGFEKLISQSVNHGERNEEFMIIAQRND